MPVIALLSYMPELNPTFLTFILAIVIGEIAGILLILSFARTQIISVTDARSRERQSPLGEHMADEKAHEPMRDLMLERLERQFTELKAEIHNDRAEHARQGAEYRAMVEAALEQNERLLNQLRACTNVQMQSRTGSSPVLPVR